MCFALATGVGKTRLMGAFIAYLHAAYGYCHFFVLAPNLTIYNKLIRDFTLNTDKYVFKGVSEFAVTVPEVVTGDNYEQRGTRSLLGGIEVNIFNISKINSEVRGGKAPRIKRLSEYLGQSYFDYLSALPDLVLLMDESHRYRASAGVRAINELKPLIGLELTATPFTEGTGGRVVPFKNVVMDYPLARAIEDGFVKEPAVVTQQNFDPQAHSAEALERIKLMDGVRVHEETKVHLLTYAQQHSERLVKPFMLVIARDTTHASKLMTLMESSEFFNGRYAGKVIQVDSSTTSGTEGDEIVAKLLDVESYEEPTEIVIHVNMLKEGWDVTNLYTIVPLRAANARTLIEQSIGRGLRLPYGRKTGVEAVDRLNIIAHDRFQEVIDEAGRADSPIRLKQLKLAPSTDGGIPVRSVPVVPKINALLGIDVSYSSQPGVPADPWEVRDAPNPRFSSHQAVVARTTLDIIDEVSRQTSLAPTSTSLLSPDLQAQIVQRVAAQITPAQAELLPPEGPSIADIVKETTTLALANTIDVPRILVKPKGTVRSGYRTFSVDVSRLNFQPQDQQLVGRGLHSGQDVLYGEASTISEKRPEDYIVRELINFDDVSYESHSDLIYELAGQVVRHFKSYLKTDGELHNVLAHQAKAVAENVHAQMVAHYFEEAGEAEVVITQGFTPLKRSALTAAGPWKPLNEAPEDLNRISSLVYGGFTRCAYLRQKFQSNPERIVAQILERDSLVWYRPVSGQFNIYYRSGVDQSEYIPDFVASTPDANLIIEAKRASEMETEEVQAKKRAALQWCAHATEYAQQQRQKPWKYLLIPHDAVAANVTLQALTARYEARGG